MTVEEKNELERAIFYGHFQMIEIAVKDVENPSTAYNIGRVIGMMHETLRTWPTEEGEAVK